MFMRTYSEGDRYVAGILTTILVVLAGIFFTYTYLSDAYRFYRDARRYMETTAVISDIHTYKPFVFSFLSPKGRYIADVRYEAEGKSYTGSLGYSSGKMRVGDKITTYYDPQAPGRIYGEEHGRIYLLYSVLNMIVLAGIWWFNRWYID